VAGAPAQRLGPDLRCTNLREPALAYPVVPDLPQRPVWSASCGFWACDDGGVVGQPRPRLRL